MEFKWKDFLYFQKNDRNAIFLLAVLILLCLIFIIFSESFLTGRSNPDEEKTLAEFDKFQRGLMNKELPKQTNDNYKTAEEKKSIKDNPSKKLVSGETIELNHATIQTLKRIPGIGNEYAKKIVEYHDLLGGYVVLEQLKEIEGITDKKYTNICNYVRINKKNQPLKINKLFFDDLIRHPYINENQAQVILTIRKGEGRITSIEKLLSFPEFTPRDIERLSAYVSLD